MCLRLGEGRREEGGWEGEEGGERREGEGGRGEEGGGRGERRRREEAVDKGLQT